MESNVKPSNVTADDLIKDFLAFMRSAPITENELLKLSAALDVLVRVKLDGLA
jgi:hypothetical protein